MFNESEFNKDISNWDVSNVEDISSIFLESKFNNDILEWNLVNNTDNISLKGYNRKEHLEFLKVNYPEYFFN